MAISIQGRRTPLISVLMTLALSTCLWSQDAISSNKVGAPDTYTSTAKTKGDEIPPVSDKAHDDNFVIGTGDVLNINVWKEAGFRGRFRSAPTGEFPFHLQER